MKKNHYTIGLIGLLATASLAAAPIDTALLVGTWHCSFEARNASQTLVSTSVDTYFADGTSRSESHLSFELPDMNLAVAYELTLEATWQLANNNQLQETIVAVPKFITSNPALEQVINLQTELMNGKTESAQIIELSQNRAVFLTEAADQRQQEISCTR